MSKAFKCDICGDLYAPYGSYDKPNRLVTSYYASGVRSYDCCPACMATLRETIKMLGDNKDETD